MVNLKCWKLQHRGKVATNWTKKGNYINETLRPLVDVRAMSHDKNNKEYRVETYDIGSNRKFRENITGRKSAEKRAIQIMRKFDKC